MHDTHDDELCTGLFDPETKGRPHKVAYQHANRRRTSSPVLSGGIAGTPLERLLKISLNADKTPKFKDFQNKGKVCVPSPYLGILAGANNLLIVDLDHGDGRNGNKEWIRMTGSRKVDTFAVATPHGAHLYFLDPQIEGLPSTANLCGHMGLDTRVGNSYAAFFYPIYRPLNLKPIGPPPAQFVEAIGNELADRDTKLKARETAAGGTQKHSLMGLLHAIYNAPQGQRNATLFWAASRVAEMPARRHGSALRQIERAAEDIGLHHTEVAKTVASAMGGAR